MGHDRTCRVSLLGTAGLGATWGCVTLIQIQWRTQHSSEGHTSIRNPAAGQVHCHGHARNVASTSQTLYQPLPSKSLKWAQLPALCS